MMYRAPTRYRECSPTLDMIIVHAYRLEHKADTEKTFM